MEARYAEITAPRAARMQSAIRGLILAAIAGLVALGLSLGAAPATATFPGENGKIAFASDRTGSWEIWTMTSDGSNETKITHSPITSESQPSFSPNGKNILYVRAGELNCGLPSRPTCSREIFDDTTNWTPDGWKSFANAQPAYSPLMYGDHPQRRIVWSSTYGAAGTGACIWTKTRAQDSPTQLTNCEGDDLRPSYSPDGRQIVFDGQPRSFNRNGRQVIVMNPNGGHETELWQGSHATFSPDGERIAFQTNTGCRNTGDGCGIAVIDSDGKNFQPVISPPGCCRTASTRAEYPSWSPDGTRIAYQQDNDIWSVNVASCTGGSGSASPPCGRSREPLTTKGHNVQPDWGPTPHP